jgi:mRNA-degrading endonuclease toxin of MazEF toxin-antitoxin module
MVKRGELYRVAKPTKHDPKNYRVFVIVGRKDVIESSYSTVACVPIYTNCLGIATEVEVGIDEGLIGSLSEQKILELNNALKIALELED